MSDEGLRRARKTLETYIIRSGDVTLGPTWHEAMDALDALAARSEPRERDASIEGYWERAYWDVVPKLQAALAATPPAPALDVERLARALWNDYYRDGDPQDWERNLDNAVEWYRSFNDMAEALSREYADLAPERQETE